MTAIARILQWPKLVPLLNETREEVRALILSKLARSGVAEAKAVAMEIERAGDLLVVDWDNNPPIGVYATLKVRPSGEKKTWWINLRPRHFPRQISHIPEPDGIWHLKFRISDVPTGRRTDPSSYLIIENINRKPPHTIAIC